MMFRFDKKRAGTDGKKMKSFFRKKSFASVKEFLPSFCSIFVLLRGRYVNTAPHSQNERASQILPVFYMYNISSNFMDYD